MKDRKKLKTVALITLLFFVGSLCPGILVSSAHATHVTGDSSGEAELGGGNPAGPPPAAGGGTGGQIYLWDGREYFESTDLIIPGYIPIELGRSYDSRSMYDSPLGYGWSFSYNERVFENRDGSIVMRTKSGYRYIFVHDGGTYRTPRGLKGTLEEDGTGAYTFREHDGRKRHFDAYGRLSYIRDPFGNRLVMEYDPRGKLPLTGISAYSPEPQTSMIVAYDHRLTRVKEQNASLQDTGRYVEFLYNEATGRLTKARDHTGREVVYGRDAEGRLTSVTDPNGNVRSYEYGDPYDRYNITRFEGPSVYENTYDDKDRVIRQVHNQGVLDMDYETDGIPKVKTVVLRTRKDKEGNTLHNFREIYEFNEHGEVLSITDDAGNVLEHNRDVNGYVLSRVVKENLGTGQDPILVEHSRVEFTYDLAGNKLTETVCLDAGEVITKAYTYDHNRLATETLVSSLDPTRELKTAFTFYHDGEGYPTGIYQKEVLVANNPERWLITINEYDDNGHLSKITAPNGDERDFAYTNGLLTNENGVVYSYDLWGNRSQVTDRRGNTTTYVYDTGNRLLEVENPLNEKTVYTYTGWNLTQVEYGKVGQDPGRVVSFGYDSGNRLHEITLGSGPDAAVIGSLSYDSDDNIITRTDGDARTTTYDYDQKNRVVSILDPLSGETRLEYDAAGNLTRRTDAADNVTEYFYDDLRRLVRVEDALDQTVEYTYDAAGRILSVEDPNEHTNTFAYDLAGRLSTETRPLSQVFQYFWDPKGRLESAVDAEGQRTTFTYNEDDQILTVAYGNPVQRTLTFTRDANGNVETCSDTDLLPSGVVYSLVYDELDRVTTSDDAFLDKTVVNTYDRFGRRSNLAVKQGPNTLFQYEYAYNDKNIPTALTLPGNRTVEVDHLASGRVETIRFPNGMTANLTYDGTGRLDALQYLKSDQSLLAGFSHDYDHVGNVTDLTDPDGLHEFTYDDTYRVTGATHPNLAEETYTYDAAGNRLTSAEHSDWTYDDNNRLTSWGDVSYTYNANGGTASKTVSGDTTTFAYNIANRLTTVSATGLSAAYRYDFLGRRVEKAVNGATTRYLYDGTSLLAELDEFNNVMKRYAYLPGQPTPVAMTDAADTYWYVNNHIGYPKFLVDETETVVWTAAAQVFGSAVTVDEDPDGDQQNVVNNVRFPGQYFDEETGLHYNQFRYYDPDTGRYLREDPFDLLRLTARLDPLLIRIGLTNQYVYTWNNPINWFDSTGLVNEANILRQFPGFTNAFPNSEIGAYGDIVVGSIALAVAEATATAAAVSLLAGPEFIPLTMVLIEWFITSSMIAYNCLSGGLPVIIGGW